MLLGLRENLENTLKLAKQELEKLKVQIEVQAPF